MNQFTANACSVWDLQCYLHSTPYDKKHIPQLDEAIAKEEAGQNRITVLNKLYSFRNKCERAL